MARIKIELPEKFSFTADIPVRITDINYGGHVGNDAILSILHEARMQFLMHYGYTEMNLGGAGLIMSDAAIEFKSDLFYGDMISASVFAGDFSKISFDFFYRLEKKVKEGNPVLVATAKTGMVCYDYANRKITAVPEEVRKKLTIGNQQ
jgi:acyl-CoA thioesterase FadM